LRVAYLRGDVAVFPELGAVGQRRDELHAGVCESVGGFDVGQGLVVKDGYGDSGGVEAPESPGAVHDAVGPAGDE